MVRLAAAQRDQGPSCPQEDKEVRSSSLTLVDLPAEVQVHIYSFVGRLPFLFSLCFVCKALNRLVKEELPWLLSDVSLSRCAQVDDAFLEHMLKIYGKTPFRPRHLDLSGCHNVSLDMLNRLLVNSDNLLTLKLAGCFQLLADPRERTERTAKLRSLAWGDRDLFVRSTEREPDDDYDVDALPEHADKLDGGDANDEANGEQPRSEEDRRLLAHRVNVRVLTSRLHTVTTLNLSGSYTVGASVYLEKILAECPNLVDLNIAGWTLRKTPAALLAGCGKLQRLSLANVRPMVATDKPQLKRLADSCPLLRVLDLSGTQPPPVKSFGRYFAFLERVVLVRISALADHDTWPQQKALVMARSKEPSDPRAAGSPILVVHHTFHVSTPDALRDSLAAAEKLEVDINAPLLIEQRRIELTHRDMELLKKGFVGTLLTQVVYMVRPELVQVVLEHGADPNIANALDGQSPLYIALRNFKRITRLMHAIGNLKSHEELVPALPELQRIRDNQRTIIDMLLAHKASVAAIPNEPDSCFSEAVLSDDLDLVQSLITTGKLKTEDLVRPYSEAGCSILHRAILAKQPWNWLGFCWEVQGRSSSPVTGYPPQVNGSLDVVRFLIEELGAYPFDSEGGDAETHPRRRYRYRLVQKRRLDHTPWERALMYGDGKLVKAIIRRFSPDLAALDYIVKWKGEEIAVNALHYATMHRNEDVVRTLLKLGLADEATAPYPRFTWRCENYSYTTHAQTRADNGHTQEMCPHVAVVRHLWPLGSKHVVDIFKVAKRSGDTYLHAHIADININVLALVLENGVDPNRKNANGDTAAHILMRKGVRRHWRRAGSWYIAEGLTPYDREKLRLLHTYRADLDSANSKRATPLHMAVNNNDAETVKLLLGSLGVEPDPLDANGLTPLQLAVSNRQVGQLRLLVAGGADADQRVSAAMARFIVRRRAELAGEEAEWRARQEKGKRGKRKRPSYSDDACVDDGLVVPFAHFLRKTPQKDFVLPATSTATSTASPARGKKRKKNESESESEEERKRQTKKTKKTKKRKTKGKEKDDEVEAEEGGEGDDDDVAELVGQATMLHAAAETFGRCSGSDKQQKECLEMVEALLGERLNCAVPTKAELERDKKKKKKKTTTSRNKNKKKASRKPTIKGADPNATDAHGNTALHAFAALGLRQVVVALLLSGADVLARNDERRLGLSLLPDDELVALEKNAARLPAGSATRHLLQSLLQQHHHTTATAQLQ